MRFWEEKWFDEKNGFYADLVWLLLRFGKAEITERNNELTDFDVWKTDATSGSSVTATVVSCMSRAKRLGRALR